jgi:hypothetical protein
VCPPVPAHCALVVRRAAGSVVVHRSYTALAEPVSGASQEENRQYGSPRPFSRPKEARGRRHLIQISTLGSGTNSRLSGTTQVFHPL